MGLTVLVYGLVVSPLLHAVFQHGPERSFSAAEVAWITHERGPSPDAPHDESKPHSHDVPGKRHSHGTPHQHGEGSVEHLRVAVSPAVAFTVVLAPVGVLAWNIPGDERSREGQPERLSSMPQGP